jgi:transposase
LLPVKSGDRVKTDRWDASKLARNYRAGELTPVWVPDAAHQALRDLVRAREAAKKDELRARHRTTNGRMLLAEGAPDLMQRLSRAFQRRHTSLFCAAESPNRFPWIINTTFESRFIPDGVASTG